MNICVKEFAENGYTIASTNTIVSIGYITPQQCEELSRKIA
ncbi:hypothetical protein [Clostridium sp. DMHC 10]|nr:hypothetical protein [Clostridium sp. DMHC 10]